MDATAIAEALKPGLPDGAVDDAAFAAADGMPTLYIAREHVVDACLGLRDHPSLQFAFFADMTGVDWLPREPRFEVVFHLVSLGIAGFGPSTGSGPSRAESRDGTEPKRLRVKVRVPGDDPVMPTLSGIWKAANWAEREVFDLFGIRFSGHPDMRRILMPDDWEGYPARKDYPVQIKMTPKVYEPLQLSPEEFASNVLGDRPLTAKTRKG